MFWWGFQSYVSPEVVGWLARVEEHRRKPLAPRRCPFEPTTACGPDIYRCEHCGGRATHRPKHAGVDRDLRRKWRWRTFYCPQ